MTASDCSGSDAGRRAEPSGQIGLAQGGESGPAPEDEALEQGVRSQPVRAVHSRTSALAGRVQPRQLRAALEVGDDASHRVVRRGRDRDQLGGGVVANLLEADHQRREAAAVDRAQIEHRGPARSDRTGDDVARSQLVGEAVPVVVDQKRTGAAQRLAEQEAGADERGGVKLHELEVGHRGAGAVGQRDAVADRAARIRRPLPERRRATGGEHRRAPRDESVLRANAEAATVCRPEIDDPLTLDDRDARDG